MMKLRDLLRAGGVLVVVVAVAFVAGRSWSETKTPPAPKTKVAVFNLQDITKSYQKYKEFQEEFKKLVEPFSAKDREAKEKGEELAKEAKDGDLTAEQREAIEEKIKELQRSIEDNKKAAQKVIVKKQEEQLKALYEDIEAAAKRYAKEHGIELVMHYNDAAKEEERSSPANVARKMQAGALMPVHAAPGIDITERLKKALNDEYRKKQAEAE